MKSTVFCPSEAMSVARLMEAAAEQEGLVYLRMFRPETPVLYGPDEKFPVGGSKVLRRSDKDVATVVAAGVTLNEALKSHAALAKDGIEIRVIGAYSIKPLDAATLQTAPIKPGSLSH